MTTRTFIKFKDRIRIRTKLSKLGWLIPSIRYESMQMLYSARLLVVGVVNVMRDTEPCFVSSIDVGKNTTACRQRRGVVRQWSGLLSYFHGKSRPRKIAFRGMRLQC